MESYKPVSVAPYPSDGSNLEMYSYIVNDDNVLDVHNYPLMKRTCTTVGIDMTQGFGFNSCLITVTPSALGSPIVDAETKHLVALYAKQEEFGNEGALIAFSVTIPLNLDDLNLESFAVAAKDKVATTWLILRWVFYTNNYKTLQSYVSESIYFYKAIII